METQYINGRAKKIEFTNGGHCHDVDVDVEQINMLLEELNKERAKHGLNPTKYFPMRVSERKSPDDYGNTHYVKQREQDFEIIRRLKDGGDVSENSKPKKDAEPTDDLPF